jgi:hypothetical protein
MGPTQPPTEWVQVALFVGIKRPRRKAVHSPSSSAKINNDRGEPPRLCMSSFQPALNYPLNSLSIGKLLRLVNFFYYNPSICTIGRCCGL